MTMKQSGTKVSVSTVQGLLKRTILSETPDLMPGAFDLIIVDEAHRGYILDREMTEEEILYANQDDYMSKYKQVIEYFDAVKIALTGHSRPAHCRDFRRADFYIQLSGSCDRWLAG